MKRIYIFGCFILLLVFGCGTDGGQSAVLGSALDSRPSTPTGLSTTAGSGKNTVNWNSTYSATSYNIYWTAIPGVTTTNGTKITNVTIPYTHTGLSNGSTYYYIVTAVNVVGESAPSTVVSSTAQAIPTSIGGGSVVPSTAQNTINWGNVSGATGYNLYWSLTPGVTTSNGTKIDNVTSPYNHTGLTNGTTYYYILTAYNVSGESPRSSEFLATTVPGAPTGATVTASSWQNTITWNSAIGSTGYNIYWSTTPGVTTANSSKVVNATSPYSHTGLTNATTYYYIVTAYNAAGESVASGEFSATTAPNAPGGVRANAGNWQNSISWDKSIAATGYNIYWSTNPGVTTANGTKIADVTSTYGHTGLTNATTYYYIVTAYNSSGESTASNSFSATTVPNSPTTVTLTAGNGQNNIAWSSSAGATGYNIYWSVNAALTTVTGTKVTGVTVPFTHIGLTNGTAYYYIVTAFNASGESTASPVLSASPAVPMQPVGVKATLVGTAITVSWQPVIGATGYNIYWGTSLGTTIASTKLTTTASTSYSHTGLSGGATYYYIVTAKFATGQELASVEVVGSVPSGLSPTREIEANNTPTLANDILVNGREMRGQLSSSADVDYFKYVSTGGNVSFNIVPAISSSDGTITASVLAQDGTLVSANVLSGNNTSSGISLIANTTAGGTYYLKLDQGGFLQDYVVNSNYIIMNREFEPNEDSTVATQLTLGALAGEMRGQLSRVSDVDCFKFISTGGNIAFTIMPSGTTDSIVNYRTMRATIVAQDGTVVSSNTLSDYATTVSPNTGLTLIGNTVLGGTYYLILDQGGFQQDYIITSN